MSVKVHEASVTCRFAVCVDVRVKFEPDGDRTYGGATLKRAEVAADGRDQLCFRAWLQRSDEAEDKPMADGEIKRMWVSLKGQQGELAEYEVHLEPADTPGLYTGWIRTRKALLLVPSNQKELALKAEARLKTPPQGVPLEIRPLDEPMVPRLVFLKLWVVPGLMSGTSEAGALVCLSPDAGTPLADVPLEVRVEAQGGVTLDLEEGKLRSTGSDGTAQWTLRYGGLSWASLAGARLRVVCGILNHENQAGAGTSCEIDVGANVNGLLRDLYAARGSLQLANPKFAGGGGILSTMGDWAWPDFLTGPLWNVKSLATGDWPNTYVCLSMRDRIFEWMEGRRVGTNDTDPDEMARMNGIELSRYAMAPVHVWSGIHLAGSGSDDDPRMLDPWWRQEWESAEYLSPDGLMTWNGELSRAGGMVASSALLVVALAKLLVGYSVLASLAALKAWLLGGTAGAYVAAGGAAATTVGGYTFLCGADNAGFVEGGRYLHYRQWLRTVASRWRTEKRALGPVSPVEGGS